MAVVPCCLFDSCPGDKETTSKGTTEHQSGDDDGCGVCSPFFSCSTCASHILPQNSVQFRHEFVMPMFRLASLAWPEGTTGKLQSYSESPWRPPARA